MKTCENCGHVGGDVTHYPRAHFMNGQWHGADYCDVCSNTYFSGAHSYGSEQSAYLSKSIPRMFNALIDCLGVRGQFIEYLKREGEDSEPEKGRKKALDG